MTRPKMDPEIVVMQKAWSLFAPLSQDARERVVAWLEDRIDSTWVSARIEEDEEGCNW